MNSALAAAIPLQRPGIATGVLFRWHRRLGLLACVAVITWSLSGLMHPLMSRYQPQPAPRALPPPSFETGALLPLGAALMRNGIASVVRARLLAWPAGTFWQVETQAGAVLRYLDAADGSELPDGDRQYAEYLARHFLAEPALPVETARLDHFDEEYVYVNRLLPVWRVRFARADGMRAYVDTAAGELATLIDDRKAVFNAIFRLLHNWGFFGGHERLRLMVATPLLLAAFGAALSGFVLYGWPRRQSLPARRPISRRVHRLIGITVSLMLLTFALTGGYHLLWQSARRIHEPVRTLTPVAANALDFGLPEGRSEDVRLVTAGNVAYLRAVPAPSQQDPPAKADAVAEHDSHAHGHEQAPAQSAVMSGKYLPVAGSPPLNAGDADYARALAAALTGLSSAPITSVEPQPAYTPEYGFVFKLLPVYRVAFDAPHAPRAYVHVPSGKLAARVDDHDYLEGWTFANLHKWNWLAEIIGRWPRDLFVMFIATLQVVLAGLGVWIYARRR